jgi:hypothetical protein
VKRISYNFNVLSRHSSWRSEETHEKRHDSRSPDRDLNPGPPEYEVGVSTTRPRRSAKKLLSHGSIIILKQLTNFTNIRVISSAGRTKYFSCDVFRGICISLGVWFIACNFVIAFYFVLWLYKLRESKCVSALLWLISLVEVSAAFSNRCYAFV